jgi:hypothetical protein
VDQDPNRVARVELHGSGWAGPLGYCPTFTLSIPWAQDAAVTWETITADIVWSQAVALLILQGKPLQDFFNASSFCAITSTGFARKLTMGPHMFLRGTQSSPAQPQSKLTGAVLARVTRAPAGWTRDQLLAHLLKFAT